MSILIFFLVIIFETFSKKCSRIGNLLFFFSKQGRNQVAQELLQRALELDKEFIEAYSSLATIYAADGKMDDAENLHLKALSLDPNNADSFNNYGTFLQKSGKLNTVAK